MNYWICMTDETNWNVIKTKKTWGVSEKHKDKINMTNKNDELVFYVKPLRLGGIFNVISEPFYDKTPIFPGGGYPYRIKLESIIVPKRFLDFYSLIKKLSFITQKKRRGWGGHLQGKAMRIIPKGDFELIKEKLEQLV